MKRPTEVPLEKHLTELPPPPGNPQPVVKSASSFTINLLGSKRYRITIETSAEELQPTPAPSFRFGKSPTIRRFQRLHLKIS